MKALAYGILMLAYAALGFVQWLAEVDGLHEILGWPSFLCWLVAGFTAFIPIIGTAAGVWGAHAAWGWAWLPAFALFLGIPLFFLLVGGVAIGVAGLAAAHKVRKPITSSETTLIEAQELVRKYGAVLAQPKPLLTSARSEADLPGTKEQIKGALVDVARQARRSGASVQSLEPLRVGYASLCDFVSQREAAAVARFDNLVGTGGPQLDDASLRQLAAKIVETGAGALDVKRRTAEEFARLLAEFDERVRE